MKTYTAVISVPVKVQFGATDDDKATLALDDVISNTLEGIPGAMKDAAHLISLDGPDGTEICRG